MVEGNGNKRQEIKAGSGSLRAGPKTPYPLSRSLAGKGTVPPAEYRRLSTDCTRAAPLALMLCPPCYSDGTHLLINPPPPPLL